MATKKTKSKQTKLIEPEEGEQSGAYKKAQVEMVIDCKPGPTMAHVTSEPTKQKIKDFLCDSVDRLEEIFSSSADGTTIPCPDTNMLTLVVRKKISEESQEKKAGTRIQQEAHIKAIADSASVNVKAANEKGKLALMLPVVEDIMQQQEMGKKEATAEATKILIDNFKASVAAIERDGSAGKRPALAADCARAYEHLARLAAFTGAVKVESK